MEETKKPNHVHVTVDNSGTVVCYPNPLPATGRDIKLKFVLKTDGYVFPNEGAVVVSQPGLQFPEASQTVPPNDTIATLFDRNTAKGDFSYTVTVQQVSSGQLLRIDPTIINGE
jgi:hypothetical protein